MLISVLVRRPMQHRPIVICFIGIVSMFVVVWRGMRRRGMFNCEDLGVSAKI